MYFIVSSNEKDPKVGDAFFGKTVLFLNQSEEKS